MANDDKQQVNFTVDADAYERAKKRTEHGEISSRLRQTIQETAYGAEVTERKRLKEKLEDERAEKRDIENQIEELKHERDEVARRISRTEDRLDTLMDSDGEYEGFLQALESDLHDGIRLDPQHGKVERAAELGDCTVKDVIQSLKERNPEVPDEAFRLPEHGESGRWKPQTETQYR